jgi:prepilin-type N-terminal cleavage/methylation domain-containing protein
MTPTSPSPSSAARNPHRSAADGFTLLEMLVGLILLSLIAVLLTQSLNTGRSALAAIERLSGDAAAEGAQGYLRRVLSQAKPVRLPAAKPDAPLIQAQGNRLNFVSDFVPAGQYGGLYSIALELVPTATAGVWDLLEIRTLYRPPAQPGTPEPAQPQTRSRLLRDIAGIAISYFGVREEEQPAEWGSDWVDPVKLPRLIAIDVAFPRGDRREWTTMVVEVAAAF